MSLKKKCFCFCIKNDRGAENCITDCDHFRNFSSINCITTENENFCLQGCDHWLAGDNPASRKTLCVLNDQICFSPSETMKQ
mmetsp:Transcript_5510/g.7746  ORF Transcript_5510/g.7746 Transcript_5510/m.7746 type:complete len:82 (+) Transcript_5510:337-582(+)